MSAKAVPGTPFWLRKRNERTVLSLLLEHGVLTRNRIGEISGLSKPTTSQIVARLEGAGLIGAVGEVSGGRGPNAVSYGVCFERLFGVAIDVSKTEIRSTVVDAGGTEYSVVQTTIKQSGRKRSAVAEIRSAIDLACAAAKVDTNAVHVVAIGVQGSIDPRTDELNFIGDMRGWPGKGIRKHLETELGLEVHIDNDVKLAAIAERCEGAGVNSTSFVLFWMGEGLGLALDLAGTVHRGAAGGAGEIGYLSVPWNAASFDANAHELQDLVGGPAVVAIAREHGVSGADDQSVLGALAEHVAHQAVFTEVARRVALGVAPVLAILDPELIVIGGPVGTAGGKLLAKLVRKEIEETTLWHPEVISSTIPKFPVLRGAREVLAHQIQQHLFNELNNLS